MRTLARNKPFGYVCGAGEGYCFSQDGRKFNGQGFEVVVVKETPVEIPVEMPPSLISAEVIEDILNMASDCPDGLFIEIGVYKGGSAKPLYDLAVKQDRPIALFDTFEGMPYADPELDSHIVGEFGDVDFGEICRLFPKAMIFKGVFPFTFPPYLPDIAFAHVDCDQYECVKAACEILSSQMIDGGVIMFDDYGLAGAKKAINEAFGDRVLFTKQHNKAFVCDQDVFPWQKYCAPAKDASKDVVEPDTTPTEETTEKEEKKPGEGDKETEDKEEDKSDLVSIVLETNPKSYKKREEIMEALDILEVKYSKRQRRTVLTALLKTAIEKRK